MAKVKCRFTGARPLNDGSLTGMLVFENVSKAIRHALLDLEGEVYLTNEVNQPTDTSSEQALKLKDAFNRIFDILLSIGIDMKIMEGENKAQVALIEELEETEASDD